MKKFFIKFLTKNLNLEIDEKYRGETIEESVDNLQGTLEASDFYREQLKKELDDGRSYTEDLESQISKLTLSFKEAELKIKATEDSDLGKLTREAEHQEKEITILLAKVTKLEDELFDIKSGVLFKDSKLIEQELLIEDLNEQLDKYQQESEELKNTESTQLKNIEELLELTEKELLITKTQVKEANTLLGVYEESFSKDLKSIKDQIAVEADNTKKFLSSYTTNLSSTMVEAQPKVVYTTPPQTTIVKEVQTIEGKVEALRRDLSNISLKLDQVVAGVKKSSETAPNSSTQPITLTEQDKDNIITLNMKVDKIIVALNVIGQSLTTKRFI